LQPDAAFLCFQNLVGRLGLQERGAATRDRGGQTFLAQGFAD
jgi:hypothetical protein